MTGKRCSVALQAFENRRKKHTATISQMAWANGIMFHRLPSWLRPIRDLVFDHTPLLQKVVGEATPGQILSQLAEIDAVEARRAQTLGGAASTSAVGNGAPSAMNASTHISVSSAATVALEVVGKADYRRRCRRAQARSS